MLSVQLEKRGLESQIKQEETAKSRVEQEKSSLRQEICELQKKLQQSELVCPISHGCFCEKKYRNEGVACHLRTSYIYMERGDEEKAM